MGTDYYRVYEPNGWKFSQSLLHHLVPRLAFLQLVRHFRVQRRSEATTVVSDNRRSASRTGDHDFSSSSPAFIASTQVAVAQPPPMTGTLRVCQATEDEWNAFADSDGQIVRPKFLEWFADTEEIHIIEFADTPHEQYRGEFLIRTSFADRNVHRWLCGYVAAVNSQGRRWCPDLSYATPNDAEIRASSWGPNIRRLSDD